MAVRPKPDHTAGTRRTILAMAFLSAAAIIVWPSPTTMISIVVTWITTIRFGMPMLAADAR